MTATSTYRLVVHWSQRLLVFGMMGVFTIIGLTMIVAALLGSENIPPLLFLLPWCGAIAWNWNVLLRLPYEIRFEPDEKVSFVAMATTTTLALSELRSIKPYGAGGGGLFIVRHSGRKLRLYAQFTGFHEVVARIKTANPQFETVGT